MRGHGRLVLQRTYAELLLSLHLLEAKLRDKKKLKFGKQKAEIEAKRKS